MSKKLKNYILALDFDGVIWNGILENYKVSLLTYQKLNPVRTPRRGFSKPSNGTNKKFLPTAQTQKKFLQGRYLCRTGDEFYLILKLIEQNPKINFFKIKPQVWKKLKQKHKKETQKFAVEFYNERHKIQKDNFKHWMNLQGPYNGIIPEIKKLKRIFKHVYIATAKDKKSVEILLGKYKLNLNIISREFSLHKDKQIIFLKNKLNTDFNQIIFIDDFLENLLAVKKLGVKVAMTSWGYNTSFIRKKARNLNIPVVKLKDLSKQIIALAGV